MTQSVWCQVLVDKLRPAPCFTCAWWRLASALLLLITPSIVSAQEEPPARDCLQDKKLEVDDAGVRVALVEYERLKRKAALTAEDEQTIERAVKYYVYQLSWPELRKGEINQVRSKLVADANAAQYSSAFRRQVSRRVLQYVPDLFDNHCLVRMVGARLLAELDDEQAFESGVARLAVELPNPEQDEGLKYVACQAIRRLANRGFRLLRTRDDAMNAVVAMLQARETLKPWTQHEAIDALNALAAPAERLRALEDRELLPAVQVLLEAVNDRDAGPRVRARAAEALGTVDVTALQTPLNYHLIAHEVAGMAADTAREYVANFDEIQGAEDAPVWKYYLGQAVVSFRGDHRETGLSRGAAADADQLTLVKQAEEKVVALTKAVLDPLADAGEIDQPLGDLQAWLDQNAPIDRRLAPGLPALPERSSEVSP